MKDLPRQDGSGGAAGETITPPSRAGLGIAASTVRQRHFVIVSEAKSHDPRYAPFRCAQGDALAGTQSLVEERRVAEPSFWPERVVGHDPHPRPSQPLVQPL